MPLFCYIQEEIRFNRSDKDRIQAQIDSIISIKTRIYGLHLLLYTEQTSHVTGAINMIQAIYSNRRRACLL